jgi:hypothetical protein
MSRTAEFKADERSNVTNLDAGSSFVTITLSRETAENIVDPSAGQDDGATMWDFYGKELVAACRAALKEQR